MLIKELREAISKTLAQEKSHTLPKVCERLGLAPGEENDAFKSKHVYVMARIDKLPEHLLVELAENVLAEYYSYELEEIYNKISSTKVSQISTITRKKIIDYVILSENIPGDLDPIPFK